MEPEVKEALDRIKEKAERMVALMEWGLDPLEQKQAAELSRDILGLIEEIFVKSNFYGDREGPGTRGTGTRVKGSG